MNLAIASVLLLTAMPPLEAAFSALQDAAQLPPHVRPFVRYVHVHDGKQESRAAVSFIANAALFRSARIVQAVPVNEYVVRLDFHEGAGDLKTYEKLWPDPFFNVVNGGIVSKRITVAPYRASDGRIYTEKIITQQLIFHEGVLPHAQALADLLGTNVPIVDARYLTVRAMATVDYGFGPGLYYDFVGIKKSPNKNQTDIEFFYSQFGVDLKQARKNLVVSRAAILNRELNNKLSAIEIVQGTGHPATTDGKIYATYDLQDRDNDVQRDPIENLLAFVDNDNHRAGEIIAPKRNGMHIYALYDSKGDLQVEVPPDIAVWTHVPNGHTNRLIPGIACVQCHMVGKEMGIRSFTNDVRDLTALFDLTDNNSKERLQSEYGHDLSHAILETRNYLADAVFLATGGMSPDKASEAVFALWSALLYEPVDAQAILLDCGIKTETLRDAQLQLGFVPSSNPYIQSLVLGKRIGRKQAMRVYPDIAKHFKKEVPK